MVVSYNTARVGVNVQGKVIRDDWSSVLVDVVDENTIEIQEFLLTHDGKKFTPVQKNRNINYYTTKELLEGKYELVSEEDDVLIYERIEE